MKDGCCQYDWHQTWVLSTWLYFKGAPILSGSLLWVTMGVGRVAHEGPTLDDAVTHACLGVHVVHRGSGIQWSSLMHDIGMCGRWEIGWLMLELPGSHSYWAGKVGQRFWKFNVDVSWKLDDFCDMIMLKATQALAIGPIVLGNKKLLWSNKMCIPRFPKANLKMNKLFSIFFFFFYYTNFWFDRV